MLSARDMVYRRLRVACDRPGLEPPIVIRVLAYLHRMPARAHTGHVQRVRERQQMINLAPLKPAQISGRWALETLSSFERGDYPSESSCPEDFGKKSALTEGVSSQARLNA